MSYSNNKLMSLILLLMLSFSSISANTLEKEKMSAVLTIITQFILTNNSSSTPTKEVVDISLNTISTIYQSYTVTIYSDNPAPTDYSKESLAIHGTIDLGERIILEVNNLYSRETKFLVVVKNSSNKIVGESTILSYDSGLSDIDFGNIITRK